MRRSQAALAACLTLGFIAPHAQAVDIATYESLTREDQLRIDTLVLTWVSNRGSGKAFNICDDAQAISVVRREIAMLDDPSEIARIRAEIIASTLADDGQMDIASMKINDAVRDGLSASDLDASEVASKRAVLPNCK